MSPLASKRKQVSQGCRVIFLPTRDNLHPQVQWLTACWEVLPSCHQHCSRSSRAPDSGARQERAHPLHLSPLAPSRSSSCQLFWPREGLSHSSALYPVLPSFSSPCYLADPARTALLRTFPDFQLAQVLVTQLSELPHDLIRT